MMIIPPMDDRHLIMVSDRDAFCADGLEFVGKERVLNENVIGVELGNFFSALKSG